MSFSLDLGNLLVHLKLERGEWDKTVRAAEKVLERTARKLDHIAVAQGDGSTGGGRYSVV